MRMRPLVLLGLAILVLWAVLWIVFRIVTVFVHLLAVVALLLILWGLLKRGRRQVGARFGNRSTDI
jgi:hypothetical protein